MGYHQFKISKARLPFLVLKLSGFIGSIFLLAKLRYEAQLLATLPMQLIDFLFILTCLAIGWLYRIAFDDIVFDTNGQRVKISVQYNFYGFVFVKVYFLGDIQTSVRLWSPVQFKWRLSADFDVECVFKPNDSLPRGGCRLVKG